MLRRCRQPSYVLSTHAKLRSLFQTSNALLSETFPDMSDRFPDIWEERFSPINGRLINEGLRDRLEKLATFTSRGGFQIS